MTDVFVHGIGVVSPAGWNKDSLRDALLKNVHLAPQPIARPGWTKPLLVRPVPPPASKPAFFAHQRLRRSSPITQYAVAAALEAVGSAFQTPELAPQSLGIVLCVLSGCVNYSRRFYEETLRNPAEASPLIFPETVFNAPASHLASLLGIPAISYTVVGDSAVFLQGLAIAADWLVQGRVDAGLVVAAEEIDWLTADAFRLFQRGISVSAGAGALFLRPQIPAGPAVRLAMITDPASFTCNQDRWSASLQIRNAFPEYCPSHFLCDGLQGHLAYDAPEAAAWRDWPGLRLSPKTILGEGLAASGAWQCAAAVDTLHTTRYTGAHVSVVGCNQHAIGAHFEKLNPDHPPDLRTHLQWK